MPFHRFEDFEAKYLSPHLSSGEGPVIEGKYMYFCKVRKEPGTGSQYHYHPNELMIFPLVGRINAMVGKERKILSPGTFVHVPPYARHSMFATEDKKMEYLYVKDHTWTVVGLAADEAPPEEAPTVDEINEKHDKGTWANQERDASKSEIIIDGIKNNFYPIIDSLDAPERTGYQVNWIQGERLSFGFVELPAGMAEPTSVNEREQFIYILSGSLHARVDSDEKAIGEGDIIEIPQGSERSLRASDECSVRYASVRSTPELEKLVNEAK